MTGLDAAEIRAARAHLAGLDEALARADAATPDFPWRVRDGGFAGLVRILINQQVSNAAAAAVWARLEAGLGQVSAENALRCDLDRLKGFGLSGPKARSVLSIAQAERDGATDFERLGDLDDETALAILRSLVGVGRWTAEVYLSFCEGRRDFFPAGDVALQEAVRLADRAERRLTETQLYRRAERWRPHRGVAAHLLWAYYGGVKRGEIGAERLTRAEPVDIG
jgi:DNA-3-methyladenine glycosylase II